MGRIDEWDLRKTVVEDEDIENAIQVQEEDAIGKTVVDTKAENNGLREDNSECHRSNESELLENVDFAPQDGRLIRIYILSLGSCHCDDQSRKCLWDETHDNCETKADDNVDQEDPFETETRVGSNPTTNWRSKGRSNIGADHEESHCLTGAIDITKEIRDGTGNIGESGRSGSASQEHEDDEHGKVSRICGSLEIVRTRSEGLNA
jgi:hypothetical protein